MACMNDWESIPFRCGYEPCQHEWSESFHKHDFDGYATKKCPKCGVFNAKRCDISDLVKSISFDKPSPPGESHE